MSVQNNILKLSYNTNHIQHVLSVEKINEMTNIEKRYPISRLPVCNHCESLSLWSKTNVNGDIKRSGTCLKCGTVTIEPITYAQYLIEGHDLPSNLSAEKKEEIKVMRSLEIN